MCQPKSKGGKRCLAHAAASKFVVRSTIASTKAEPQTVNRTLSELNKEGKNLNSPSQAEVKQWIDTQKFVAQHDPDLDDHDRKIGLNQLERAEEEVQAGVTGGQFHAWKNLKETVRSKIARRVAALALTPLIAFGAVGCSTGMNPLNDLMGGSKGTVAESTLEGHYLTGGEEVKDELGEYSRFPSDSWNAENGEKTGPNNIPFTSQAVGLYVENQNEFDEAGFTQEDVEEGLRASQSFIYEAAYDSKILDRDVTNAEYAEWYGEVSSNIPMSKNFEKGLSDPSNEVVLKGAGSESGGTTVPFVRDGNKRYLSSGADANSVQAANSTQPISAKVYESEEGTAIYYEYKVDFPYRVSDSEAISMYSNLDGMSKEDIIAGSKNNLTDNKGENIMLATGKIGLVTLKDDSGKMVLAGVQQNATWDVKHFMN